MADKKETLILDFEADTDEAEVSIEKLTAANKRLREERKKVDLTTEEGIKTIKRINKELDENNETIKNNSSALEKQRLNIGNYGSAIDKLIPGFESFRSSLDSIKSGFGSFTKSIDGATLAQRAFLLPVALIIAAVALLMSWFSRTEAGADTLAKIMAQLGAVFNVIADRAAALGGAVAKLFTGDFLGAMKDAKAAFSGVGDEIMREADEAGKLAEILDELEDRERSYKVAASATTLEIKRLVAESKNRKLSEEDKIKLLEKATNLEIESNKKLKLIKQDALSQLIRETQLTDEGGKMKQKWDETQLEFAERMINNELIQKDVKDKLAEGIIAYNSVEGDSLVIQEKLQNQIDNNLEKQKIREEKQAEIAAKERERLQQLDEKQQAVYLAEAQRTEDLIAKKKLANDKLLEGTIERLDKQREAEEKDFEDSIKIEEDAAEKTEEIEWATLAKKLEIWTKAHEKELELAVKSIDAAADVANKITNAFVGSYKVQENELAVKLANEKTLLNEGYQAELKLLEKRYADGEISREDYDKSIIALNQRFQAYEKNAEIEQGKALNDIKRKEFEANKKNSIAQAVADAARAIIGAMAATFGGPILKGIAAAAIATFTAIKINQIKNTEFVPTTFRQGGYTGDGDQDQIAGLTHKREFVMPAPVVAQFGKDHFQSYLDGAAIANAGGGGMGANGGSSPTVYVSWKEFTDFKNQMDVKASIVEAA